METTSGQLELIEWMEEGIDQEFIDRISKMRRIFSVLNEGINVKKAPKNSELIVNFSDFKYPIHRWFKYREGFSPDLIKRVLNINGIQRRVLDPFCGSGTTLVATNELGIEAVSFDINPMATFVSRVKTRYYTKEDIENIKKIVPNVLDILDLRERAHVPKLKIIDKIFNSEILDALLKIKHKISEIQDEKYRDFLKLGWLAILESVSNTRKEGNGIKYKFTKRTSRGYISLPQKKWETEYFGKDKSGFVIKRLKEKYNEMISDLEKSNSTSCEPRLYTESALRLTDFLESNSITTAIFSPPYANCFDYFEIFKIELWMGDFVKDYKDLRDLRSRALRSNVNTHLDVSGRELELPELNELINLMREEKLWDKNVKKVVRGYFEDMGVVLREIYQILEPGGKCIIIVGNSAYADVLIPTDLLLTKIATQIGYEDAEIQVIRHLTTSSQQKKKLSGVKEYLRESIIVLSKSKNRALMVKELPTNRDIPIGQKFIINSNDVAYLTHNMHKYPSKFIPHIPMWGVKKYLLDQQYRNVLDPFCGSGTTLVEGILAGHNVYGVDVDPLSRLITKVKITAIEEEKLTRVCREVIDKVMSRKKGEFVPAITTLSHWFRDQAVRDLSVIRDVIEEYKDDKDVYDFLIVTFSSIIRRTSNADDQSQKTYVSHTNPKEPIDVKPYFCRTLEKYKDRVVQFSKLRPEGAKYYIFEDADARTIDKDWQEKFDEKVDLAITSPPYIKAIDYIYTQMVEYFWIGDLFGLSNQKSQNEYKRRYVGTKMIYADEYSELRLTGLSRLDEQIKRIYPTNKKYAYITYRFFEDMRSNLEGMYRILDDEAHYIVVVGNCNVSKEKIPVHNYLVEIAREIGYNLENLFYYKIRNRYMRFPRKGRGGLIQNDWIIDLAK